VLQRRLVARLPHLAFAPLARDLGKILLGTLVLVAVVLVGWHFLRTHGRAGDWLALLVLIPGAAALYGATIWLLRIEGREQLTRMLLRRLPASPRGTGGP
jgi:putative peptidoglycan lipid II flippase